LEIAHADIGIYTARSSPHMDIAIPGKILEYALMGIPVIASRLRVLENLFTESSILFFEPGNDSQFACYVLELFENPARREELVQNMDRTFVRTQNWENEKREYFNVLRRLLPQGLIPQGDD
jgi:glycosyltransferase involved in cell wall biosynthesis